MSVDFVYPAFFPVIHTPSLASAARAAAVAADSGADGVFFINQGSMSMMDVLWLAQKTATMYPSLRVGVNLLGADRCFTFCKAAELGLSMVWSDDAGDEEVIRKLMVIQAENLGLGFEQLTYFGGVAFKYRPHVPLDDLPSVLTEELLDAVDVVTTSGDATGSPPTVPKIQAFRKHLGKRPLAIASGISIDNVSSFLGDAQAFLVGTSIESSFGVLDPGRTRALADAIHAARTV